VFTERVVLPVPPLQLVKATVPVFIICHGGGWGLRFSADTAIKAASFELDFSASLTKSLGYVILLKVSMWGSSRRSMFL
jgi:acetyl esterase/lipase